VIEIKEGAIFIADVHANENRKEFLNFLDEVKEINPPQLFLMGDIFDFLAYEAKYTLKFYEEEIKKLNSLSLEIIYLEGNHDFGISKIFPKIKVFPLSKQPVKVRYKNQIGFIAHGDVFSGVGYNFFHFFLRSSLLLKILNILNGEKFSKSYLQKANSKRICKKIPNFLKIAKQKIKKYDIDTSEVDFIIEGHYHQGEFIDDKPFYFNLQSFGCGGKYYKIVGDKITLK